MIICLKCQSEFGDLALYCSQCGIKLPRADKPVDQKVREEFEKDCSEVMHALRFEQGDNYCIGCGIDLADLF